MVSRQRRAAPGGALSYWLAVGCLLAGCETSEVNGNGGDAGSDAGQQCIVDAGPPSDLQYCGGMCYFDECCTGGHPDCPPTMPREGECCPQSDIYCAYGCVDPSEWSEAYCTHAGRWVVEEQAHCDPPL
jgi:hypothetical protein